MPCEPNNFREHIYLLLLLIDRFHNLIDSKGTGTLPGRKLIKTDNELCYLTHTQSTKLRPLDYHRTLNPCTFQINDETISETENDELIISHNRKAMTIHNIEKPLYNHRAMGNPV